MAMRKRDVAVITDVVQRDSRSLRSLQWLEAQPEATMLATEIAYLKGKVDAAKEIRREMLRRQR